VPAETQAKKKVLRGLPGSGAGHAGPSFAPCTSLAFGIAGSAAPSLCTLGRFAGRPWRPPSLLRQVLRVRQGKAANRGPCTYLAYGRSTCAELASRVDAKVSHDDTVEWKESRCVVPSSAPAVPGTPGRCGSGCWYPVAHPLRRACVGVPAGDAAARFGSTHASLTVRESLRCPPSRRVPHKWSGRRPYRYMGRAAAFPVRNAEDLSEQRGWAPKALRRNVRARRGISR